jgi:type IV secretion system protein VirB9
MRRLAIALLLLAAPATAAEKPMPGPIDPRIQTVQFDPDQITRLTGFFGFQTMIEFAEDERIENVAIGDALGWQVTPNKRANKLFLKPIDRRALTNMTVVTDRRRYTFALVLAGPKDSATSAPWVVRFRYPQEGATVVLAAAEPEKPADPASFNFGYASSGSRALYPSRVFDDGQRTYFEWPDGAPAPAIFALGPDGQESMVNYTVKDRYTVVQQTAARFVLRSGKAIATITNERDVAVAQRFSLGGLRDRSAKLERSSRRAKRTLMARWFGSAES